MIQDRSSRTLIGAGEQCEGVYFFRAMRIEQANKAKGVDAHDLWHQRLGHPSNHALKFVPEVQNNGSSSITKVCDVCFRAKQTREMFVDSNNKACDCFELIHCDL